MAIFPGKFICGTNLEFQSRVFLIPWVKKNFIRSCSKSSSFPVRYIPKKSLRASKLQMSSPPVKGFEGKKTNSSSRHSEDEELHTHLDQNTRLPPQRSSEGKNHRHPHVTSLSVEVSDVEKSFRGGLKDMSELQTSSPPIKVFEGKMMNPHNSRQSEDEEMRKHVEQNARLPPQRSSEDKIHRHPNVTSLSVEVPDVEKSFRGGLKDMSELQTSSPPRKVFEGKMMNPHNSRQSEDEEMHKHVEQNARLPPQWSSEDKMHTLPNLYSSKVEVSDVGRGFRRGGILKDMPETRDQRQVPNSHSTFHAKSDIVEENNHKGEVAYEFMEEPTEALEELEIHHTEDAPELLTFELGKTRQEVEKAAVQILGTRAFTAVKLKKKLLAEKFPLDIVNAVIADFRSRGFINDSLYAETFSRSRWSSSSWGPRRIKKALSEKGVNKADAEEAVKLVFEDGEAGDNQVSRLGFSKLSMDRLLSQASKQWHRGGDVPIEKRKARIIRWLQYRGFDWGVVSYVLKQLQS